MIYGNIECHGFDEAAPSGDAVRLQRVPEQVRAQLNPGAQEKVLRPACNELRCVTDDRRVRVTLSSAEGNLLAVPFWGCFKDGGEWGVGSEPVTIDLSAPARPFEIGAAKLGDMPYAPQVCRILLHGQGQVFLHGAEGKGIRHPAAEELPTRCLLTYGTSITHGGRATMPHLSYVRQLAWRLGMDLVNLGVGGACFCEHAMADYIASRKDWDAALLSLSVNMIGKGFSLDEFEERVTYMVRTVAGAEPSRPVFCVTIFPHFRDYLPPDHSSHGKGLPEEYRDRLRRAVAACAEGNVTLIEGRDVLDDITGLTGDLLHPSDLGMIRMGENLAARIAPVLGDGPP